MVVEKIDLFFIKKLNKREYAFEQTNVMNKYRLNLLTIFLLIPIFSIGPIPKGQFLDADSSVPRGLKMIPFTCPRDLLHLFHWLAEHLLLVPSNIKNKLMSRN